MPSITPEIAALFVEATRHKLRFETPIGLLGIEDLWGLPLVATRENAADLNKIGVRLSRAIRALGEESFVDDVPDARRKLEDSLEIVKFVIEYKKAERQAAVDRKEKTELKRRLQGVLASKRQEALESLSTEELERQIAAL